MWKIYKPIPKNDQRKFRLIQTEKIILFYCCQLFFTISAILNENKNHFSSRFKRVPPFKPSRKVILFQSGQEILIRITLVDRKRICNFLKNISVHLLHNLISDRTCFLSSLPLIRFLSVHNNFNKYIAPAFQMISLRNNRGRYLLSIWWT